MNNEDIFVELPGISGYYINSCGDIKSSDKIVKGRWGNWRKRKGKTIKTFKAPNNYIRVQLTTLGKPKKYLVHRLVAECFVEGYFEGAVVDHINGVRDDNRSTNLRWVTTQINAEKGSSKHYKIYNVDGSYELIYNLSSWCRTNNINISRMIESRLEDKFYKGLKLSKPIFEL